MKKMILSSLIILSSLTSFADVGGSLQVVENDETGAVFLRIEGEAAKAIYDNLKVGRTSGPASTYMKRGENLTCYQSIVNGSISCATNLDPSKGALSAH